MSRGQPSTPKKLLMGASVVVLFFLLLEGGLRVAGYEPVRVNPSDAFFRLQLFEQGTAPDGRAVWRTRAAHAANFEIETFPVDKGDTFRVFAIGGSSARGFGLADAVRGAFVSKFVQEMERRVPDREFEAVNAGGIGFGSFREAVLLREIVALDPDLVLVYSGHNEFWEYPLYRSILGEDRLVHRANWMLAGSRTVALVRDAVTGVEQWRTEIPHGFEGSYERFDAAKVAEVERQFRSNLLQMVQIAREARVPILFGTLGANLKVEPDDERDWLHDASQHPDGFRAADLQRWNEMYAAGLRSLETGDPAAALQSFRSAAAIDRSFARLHSSIGRACEGLGRYDEAYEAYWTHIDLSHRLVTRALNDVVRGVCAEEGLRCIDGARRFEEQAEHGLTDYRLFVDSMHPNEAGHALLAQAFVEAWLAD